MRSTETPLVRRTQAPSAIPPIPLTDTTELTASSDRAKRRLKRRSILKTSSNRTT